ncbi:cadherin repeat domain-containing protein, partial [Aquimarina sp. D1M17]|uniref:cadherin repeat domain-containing protein n=1 Tax=Aquimarina acroporae TaxID=2937283 RepID=UPI0020C03CA4
ALVSITITDVVESSTLTLANVNENAPENAPYTASAPALTGTPIGSVTYTISGGADQAQFTGINAATGEVTLAAQDFENPIDANGDNVYEVEVTITDADGNTDTALVSITITDVIESSTLTLADVNENAPENAPYTASAPA